MEKSSTFSKEMKSNKEYEIALLKIQDNVLYFSFNNETLHCPLYLDYSDQELNNQKDTIKVNANPFDKDDLYYTKSKYILYDDLKRIYEYKQQTSKLNIEGTFKIQIKNITFRPLRKIYKENSNIVLEEKVFPGFKVDFSFIDNIARDDFVYLALAPSTTYDIDQNRVIKDIERFNQILKQMYDDEICKNKINALLEKDIAKIKTMTTEINANLEKQKVILTLKSQRNKDVLIYYILPSNNFNFEQFLIEIKNPTIQKPESNLDMELDKEVVEKTSRFAKMRKHITPEEPKQEEIILQEEDPWDTYNSEEDSYEIIDDFEDDNEKKGNNNE